MNFEPGDILGFWFGTESDEKLIIRQQSDLWWGKSRPSDNAIKKRFGGIYRAAINDELSGWERNAKSRLAMIILLDQFSRVIHRDTMNAFVQDNKALKITQEGVSQGFDKSLRLIERVFYYMPLEHAENIDIQNQSVALFQQLYFESPVELKTEFQNYLNFAEQHRDIIKRFNRFPHRNSVLKRISGAEEIAFLAEPESSF